MDIRKIQTIGNGSYGVSLPKKWVIGNKLENHDSIFMQTTDNNELVLRATSKNEKSLKQIKIKADNPSILSEFIVFCYMKNIDKIRFYDDIISYECIVAIRNALNYLEGYEITSQTDSTIDIEFLFKDVDISIPKIIHRMYYLIKLQVSSLKNNDEAGLLDAELTSDRLCFLSTRILFACLQDYNLRIENEIKHLEDLFFIKNISKRLENISDQLVKLKDASPKDIAKLDLLVSFIDKTIITKEELSGLKTTHNNLNITSKDSKTSSVFHKLLDLCKDLLEARISLDLNEKTHLGL